MAIYHLEAKVISRGAGRSAVAASAYMSCSEILNDYDGVQHDYTRKQGLVWGQIFLPGNAPKEWSDRSTLWNAVESSEKTKDSRLAREFVVALPIELNAEARKLLLSDFIKSNFVAEGMCADVCIHDTDGHNPHAHIMLTVRPLNENGTWQYKTEKEYLCVKDDEERGLTATEFKAMQSVGWEKQYSYKVGRKKVYMTTSEAEKHEYERVNKYPKSTKFGRQNPLTEKWNSDEQLVLWRKNFADITNLHLERANCNERVDHRSHKERGIDEQPTIHEGVFSKRLEKMGVISDRAELNRQIKADNALLRALKNDVKRLIKAVADTMPKIAETMETFRQSLLLFCYQLTHIRHGKRRYSEYLAPIKKDFRKYTKLNDEIKAKSFERKQLQADKKSASILNIPKQHNLSRQITELTETLEELLTQKNMTLQSLNCADDKQVQNIKKEISDIENAIKRLDNHEAKYQAEFEKVLAEYMTVSSKALDFEQVEFDNIRQKVRETKEKTTISQIKSTYGDKFSHEIFRESKQELARVLDEDTEPQSILEMLTQNKQKIMQQSENKTKSKEQER